VEFSSFHAFGHSSPVELKDTHYALEGLAAVVNRVTCSVPVPGSTFYVHACHPRGALPAPGLPGCPVGREK
jgi:hypothetical protein